MRSASDYLKMVCRNSEESLFQAIFLKNHVASKKEAQHTSRQALKACRNFFVKITAQRGRPPLLCRKTIRCCVYAPAGAGITSPRRFFVFAGFQHTDSGVFAFFEACIFFGNKALAVMCLLRVNGCLR